MRGLKALRALSQKEFIDIVNKCCREGVRKEAFSKGKSIHIFSFWEFEPMGGILLTLEYHGSQILSWGQKKKPMLVLRGDGWRIQCRGAGFMSSQSKADLAAQYGEGFIAHLGPFYDHTGASANKYYLSSFERRGLVDNYKNQMSIVRLTL